MESILFPGENAGDGSGNLEHLFALEKRRQSLLQIIFQRVIPDGSPPGMPEALAMVEDSSGPSSLCELGEVGTPLPGAPLPRPSCPLRGRSPAAQARPAAPRTATMAVLTLVEAGRACGAEQN